MSEVAHQTMTLEEFLDWDDGTDTRYELLNGVALAMAPPNVAHGVLVTNVSVELRSRLSPSCLVVGEAGIVLPNKSDRYYVADLAVACQHTDMSKQYLDEPLMIVEVLSPSTVTHDRGNKVPDYLRIPSVMVVLLVDSNERRVQVWRREEDIWTIRDLIGDAEINLPELESSIPLSSIYTNTNL